MKDGDKVVCINDLGNPDLLTIGKTYTVLSEYTFMDKRKQKIEIMCNNDITSWTSASNFISLRSYVIEELTNQ